VANQPIRPTIFLQAIDLLGFMWGWPVLQGWTGPGKAAKEIVFLYI